VSSPSQDARASNNQEDYIGVLIEALAALPHLLEFAWIGTFPPLQQDVADALASFCPRLRHLYVEYVGVLYDVHDRKLILVYREEGYIMTERRIVPIRFGFTRLTSITCVAGYMQPGSAFYDGALVALIAANVDSLRSLTIDSDRIRHLPIRSFEGLQNLEIRLDEEHGISVQLVLRHCPQLESLVLCDLHEADVAVIVADSCGRLPSLRSLKILASLADDYEGTLLDYVHTLISFLEPILNLRRLNLCVPNTWESADAAGLAVTHLLNGIVKHCPHLEAFGLDISVLRDFPVYETLAATLSLSLGAVSLSLPWISSALNWTIITPLVRHPYPAHDNGLTRPLQLDRLAQLPHLAFLRMEWGPVEAMAHLSPKELVRDMHALQLIILEDETPSAWNVYRASEPGGEITLEPWSLRKLE
jgi:hypothetical protein